MKTTSTGRVVWIAVAGWLTTAPHLGLAAVFHVDSGRDAADKKPGDGRCATLLGACTLRAAVQETNALPGADTIRLPAGTYTLTIAPAGEDRAAGGDLDVTDSLSIAGAGSKTTTIVGNKDRVLDLVTPKEAEKLIEVHITGVTIRGGSSVDAGGGIRFAAVLTVARCRIVSNEARSRGGGIAARVAAVRDTRVYLTDSVVADNQVLAGTGGGINAVGAVQTIITRSDILRNRSTVDGGGLAANADSGVSVTEARFSKNWAAGNGGGIWGAAKIERSTLDGNVAGHFGGGIRFAAAGAISNSTISGNVAENASTDPYDEGGGGIWAVAPVEVTHVTLTQNFGGVENGAAIGGDHNMVSMTNSIILDNREGDCAAVIRSGGGNIVAERGCLNGLTVTGPVRPDDLVLPLGSSPDATLDPALRNNGGRTPTHALPLGSRAINLARAGLAVDQRGIARPQAGRFDSGAYESTMP